MTQNGPRSATPAACIFVAVNRTQSHLQRSRSCPQTEPFPQPRWRSPMQNRKGLVFFGSVALLAASTGNWACSSAPDRQGGTGGEEETGGSGDTGEKGGSSTGGKSGGTGGSTGGSGGGSTTGGSGGATGGSGGSTGGSGGGGAGGATGGSGGGGAGGGGAGGASGEF